MPVVSESATESSHAYTYGLFSNISTPYLYLSIFFFLCITIFIRRNRNATAKLQYHFPPSRPSTPILLEKSDPLNTFSYANENVNFHTTTNAPHPKTTPQSSTTSLDLTNSPTSISTAQQTFSRAPPAPPFTPPSPLETLPYAGLNGDITSTPSEAPSTRRRSYTKASNPQTNSPAVTGEIISSDGWRRHTRVFGGGVCEACAESERRMSA
ncbi:hypothetical protein SBOR_7351 [Sclerotinia borealis F-4128]|uniref:Uncharacterized protein n=1 Tax=Sclerotinia borealis (strain F-4128) TaxID=1432307 RepID=W9C670_SCLBF|nr:hypothetical protein SBOR_7351 [Sclerotinia borealis F-4128]